MVMSITHLIRHRAKKNFAAIAILLIFGSGFSEINHRQFNGEYNEAFLNRIAFPIGGMGAGMFCLEGTGTISHLSLRNKPDIFNEPDCFSAISVKGFKNSAKVLEGPVPHWKIFGSPRTGDGARSHAYGLPRFENVKFMAHFPFCTVSLQDNDIPLEINITGWSPFIPGDADNSSLPVGVLEYQFKNNSDNQIEAVYSFNTTNFMRIERPSEWGGDFEPGQMIQSLKNGFILYQAGTEENPHYEGSCAIFVDDNKAVIDHCWFRGGWFDPLTMTWKTIENCEVRETPLQKEGPTPGSSIYVPFTLKPNATKTIALQFAWYVPHTRLKAGGDSEDMKKCDSSTGCCTSPNFVSWYSGRFKDVREVVQYWQLHHNELRQKSALFRDTFFDTDLPDEVKEAVAANLSILKSPTVLRQKDGKLWAWEGCHDDLGCCYGSCTHVWNYAQAIPHLFPDLERSLRNTEFLISQNKSGHQTFRSSLPIRPPAHDFHAATDGQLGGIMKMYRDWRISGDTEWMAKLYPLVKKSMDYCIETWDPKHKGILEEPHHNTYDIEFWGPDGMCTSFYLGALNAMIQMGRALNENVTVYQVLFKKGQKYLANQLFDGEYFIQQIKWTGLQAEDPIKAAEGQWNVNYSEEAKAILLKEGPKYQYGKGCLSDGILGSWMSRVCGLEEVVDENKVKSHLKSIHKYNMRYDLTDHVNPQRPGYAMGKDGGLLICTWPKGGKLSLPFVYSNEVWTGIEYQVASHLMMHGLVEEGLNIVREARKRYDGRIRNPFNEYECGHWYARAMASYGLIQGLTGIRYDAVDKLLYIDSKIGNNFKSFLSTESGFGHIGMKKGKPFIDMKFGTIDVDQVIVSGKRITEFDQY